MPRSSGIAGEVSTAPTASPATRTISSPTRPIASSNTTASPTGRPKASPRRASTVAVPTLGWPANGSSIPGVKIRTRAVLAGSAGGMTKVVSG